MRSSGRKMCCQWSYRDGKVRGYAVGAVVGAISATVLLLGLLL